MKLYVRLLLVIPFVLVVFGYYKTYNPDERCVGSVIDLVIMFVFFGFLLVTGILAAVGTFRKRKTGKFKFEPVTFSIALATLFFLIYNLTFRGHTSGDKWIDAQGRQPKNSLSTQYLTLRKNGNFTITLDHADIGCSISGNYKISGDTIFLNQEAINKTDERMTTVYLIKSNELIPLFDTTNKRIFQIEHAE